MEKIILFMFASHDMYSSCFILRKFLVEEKLFFFVSVFRYFQFNSVFPVGSLKCWAGRKFSLFKTTLKFTRQFNWVLAWFFSFIDRYGHVFNDVGLWNIAKAIPEIKIIKILKLLQNDLTCISFYEPPSPFTPFIVFLCNSKKDQKCFLMFQCFSSFWNKIYAHLEYFNDDLKSLNNQ